MERVKDKIYYQVATDRDYRVGQKLVFDRNTINGQYRKVMMTKFLLEGKRASDFIYSKINKKFAKLKKDELYDLAHILDDYDFTLRELALEFVREKEFPDKPSRLHCLYLSNNKDTSLSNLNDFVKSKKGKQFQVVAIKLNGTIFKAGEVTIARQGESMSTYIEDARAYWSQNNIGDNKIKEILFEGTAEIVEIIKEIK